MTARLVRLTTAILAVYGGLLGLTGWQFGRAPTGFIPEQDQGYPITVLQLPSSASLVRTDEVVRRAAKESLQVPGVEALGAGLHHCALGVGEDGLGLGEEVEDRERSEEHTSELQSLMRISYAVFCLNKKT